MSDHPGRTAPTIAVVTVFNAPDDLLERVESLLRQVDAAILVDDGSDSLDMVKAGSIAGIHVLALDENSGIATALNAGIRRARELGAENVLTLDQDSTVPDGYVEQATATLRMPADGRGNPAFAVPAATGGVRVLRLRHADPIPFDPIQSGMLIPVEVLDVVGEFAEHLFIDAVDSDFTLRARRLGLEPSTVEGFDLGHELGELIPITIAARPLSLRGRPLHVLYHSPVRTYYMVRNSIYLAQTNGRGNVRWHLRRSAKLGSMVVSTILLGDSTRSHLSAVAFGIADACRHRYGKIPEATRSRIDPSNRVT